MKTSRPFGLQDLMIVVAATAAGLAVARIDVPVLMKWGIVTNPAYEVHYRRVYFAVSVLSFLTPAVLLIRLRPPRPPFTRLARQPGFVACLLATSTLILLTGRTLIQVELGLVEVQPMLTHIIPQTSTWSSTVPTRPIWANWPNSLGGWVDRVGFSVAGGWLTLKILGAWRSEASLIDRAGRALGVCWLVLAVFCWFPYLLR